ncbi:MAG: aquaporin family protein [Bacteroidales bacterium]|nr:aquaporin family protein [Bacteroidales bacterium]
METTLFTKCLFEFLGTFLLLLLGDGVCCAVTLKGTKAHGAGWIVITMAWGLAVMAGVIVAGPYSGAHLNPAISIGFALAGTFPWAWVLPYIVAQMLGGFCGAIVMYAFYVDHFAATSDKPEDILGCFCTIPAIEHKTVNFFCEFVATFILVFLALLIGTKANTPQVGGVPAGLGAVGAFPISAVIMSIGMSLGSTTGYSLNPARDLPPRFAHSILPIKGKGGSGWSYSWIPSIGPLVGAAFAACIYILIF